MLYQDFLSTFNIINSPRIQFGYFIVNFKTILVTNKPLAIFALTITFLYEWLIPQRAVIARDCIP